MRVWLCSIIAGLFLVVSGCGGSGSSGGTGGGSLSLSQMAGTWKSVQIRTSSGQIAYCPAQLTVAPSVELSCGGNDIIKISQTGSTSGQIVPQGNGSIETATIPFTIDGNTITIQSPAFGSEAAYSSTYSVSITGNVMTLKQISSTSSDPTLGSDYNGTSTLLQKQ